MKAKYTTATGEKRATAKRALRDDYQTIYANLTTNWSGFTAAVQLGVVRAACIFLMRAVRYLLRDVE